MAADVKTMRAAWAALLVTVTLAGCTEDAPGGQADAVICTNHGAIVVDLFKERAPITTQNFIDLAQAGYYDGVSFHRIITDFMMQGGDPTGTGAGGDAADGATIPDEFHPELRHDGPGILSMANGGPNTGSSQFFILFDHPVSTNRPVGAPGLDDKHSVFGQVVAGMDVVDTVEAEASSSEGVPRAVVKMRTVIIDATASDCPPEPQAPEASSCPVGAMPPRHGIVADAITPGVICITNAEDRVLVWARNFDATDAQVSWSLTAPDGAALPDGWGATFASGTTTLKAAGTTGEAGHTMLTITVPAGTSGEFPLELRTGGSVTAVTAHVDIRQDAVAKGGDAVNVEYAGRCASDDRPFDDGEFPLVLGGGRAIVGFDRGLVGLAWNEGAQLYLPARLAYGSDAGPCAGSNADLIFDVRIIEM